MSKVVTIPKDRNPFVVIVNGVKYSYPAGVTTEVPDEVADVIEKYVGAKPKPDPNAGINFGGTQSDWNQTDSSAADFIKNKPFGDVPIVIMEEQTFTYDGINPAMPISTKAPTVGSDAQVVIDGVVYTSVVDNSLGVPAIGNMGLMGAGANTGEPYFIGWNTDTAAMAFFAEPGTYTVEILGKTAVKIPERFYDCQNIFYVVSDSYIYKNLECTEKASKDDLFFSVTEKPVTISMVNNVFYSPVSVDFTNEYCSVCVNTNINGQLEQFVYYTSEYTES